MSLIERYIGTRIVAGYLVVLLVLAAIFSFLALVEELEQVGEGGYEAADALRVVMLTLPGRAVELIPVTALLGTLAGLAWLSSHSELTAIQAMGVSRGAVGRASLITALSLVAASLVLQELIAPPAAASAHMQRSMALNEEIVLRTEHGFWSRDERQFINVGHMRFGQIPSDIDIFQFDQEGQLRVFTQAERAAAAGRGSWILHGVTQKVMVGGQVHVSHEPRLAWNRFLTPKQRSVMILPPEALAPSDLLGYLEHLRARNREGDRYALALWRKLAVPFTTMVMAALAVPFAFGRPRAAGVGHQLVLGAIVGVAVYLADQVLAQLGLLVGLPAAVTALLPTTAVAVLAGGLWWHSAHRL